MAGAQTGTGKTAAFVLPLLEQLLQHPTSDAPRPIRALVLVPTRELAVQVAESVTRYARAPLSPARWSTAGEHRRTGGGAERRGGYPHRHPGPPARSPAPGALTLAELRHLVFDEADRMLDMGFMDEIQALLKQIPADRQTLLFSATCDDNLFALCKVLLRDPALVEVAPRNTTAAEVEQRVYAVDSDRKVALVQHMLTVKGWAPALIFSRTRQGPTSWPSSLARGHQCARLPRGSVTERAGKRAAGVSRRHLAGPGGHRRGGSRPRYQRAQPCDQSGVPHQPEDYVHRIGRTGRAGNKGLAITLFSPEDAPCWRKSKPCSIPACPSSGSRALSRISPASTPSRAAPARAPRSRRPESRPSRATRAARDENPDTTVCWGSHAPAPASPLSRPRPVG